MIKYRPSSRLRSLLVTSSAVDGSDMYLSVDTFSKFLHISTKGVDCCQAELV